MPERGVRLLGLMLAVALAVAIGAVIGYHAGGPAGRDVVRRAIEIQELPMGAPGAQLSLDLPPLPAAPVRNLILLIGDGMGLAQIQSARLASFGPAGLFSFERFPVVGIVSTVNATTPIGESAAAATAIATGVLSAPGRVGTAPDGRALRTWLESARDAGYATGLVSTSSITDATPAAFAAHVASRDEGEEIASQLAASRIDVLIGGGLEFFRPGSERGARHDGRDLVAEARTRGVTIASNSAELDAARAAPLWALVAGRPDKAKDEPPLGTWALRALTLLSEETKAKAQGFVLVVEDEGIDTGGHANDVRGVTRSIRRLDAAAAAAARFAAADGSTLVVLTADHSTGGLSVDATTDLRAVRVAWASAKHAGEPVPLYAYGPAGAAERFAGSYGQAELGRRLAAAMGLDLSANGSPAP